MSSSWPCTPNRDPALMSAGMMCPRATWRRCTVPPLILANWAVRLSASSGESGDASIATRIRSYIVVHSLWSSGHRLTAAGRGDALLGRDRGLDRNRMQLGGAAGRNEQCQNRAQEGQCGQDVEDGVERQTCSDQEAAEQRAADAAE